MILALFNAIAEYNEKFLIYPRRKIFDFSMKKINTADMATPEYWREYTTTLFKNQESGKVATVRRHAGNLGSYVNPIPERQSNARRNHSTFQLSCYGTYELLQSFEVSCREINSDYNRLPPVTLLHENFAHVTCTTEHFRTLLSRTKFRNSNATICPNLTDRIPLCDS